MALKIRLKEDALPLFAAIAICLCAGFLGSIATTPAIPTWYSTLIKPSFSPPNWVFFPVWTTLYILMGISAFLIYRAGIKKQEVRNALILFGIQLILNTLWSFAFFGMRSPLYGLAVIIPLWLSIVGTIILSRKISKNAGALLVPYLLWVSFAAALNFFIWQLNS